MKILIPHLPKERRRQVVGSVVSDKMHKGIVVRVDRKVPHPLYGKYIVISKKFMAHDENNEAKIGDTVCIIESRAISKYKRWRLYQIVHVHNTAESAS